MPGLSVGSCESMAEVSDNSIDLIVTSPPYWVAPHDPYLAPAAPRTQTTPKAHDESGKKNLQGNWIGSLELSTYKSFLDWLESCFSECYRVLKPSRTCAIVVGTTLVQKRLISLPFHLVSRLEHLGFIFHQDIIWHRWKGWDRRVAS